MRRKREHRIFVIPFSYALTISIPILPDLCNLFAGREQHEVLQKTTEEEFRTVRYRLNRRHFVEWKQTKWIDTGRRLVKFYTETRYYRGVGPWPIITWKRMESGVNTNKEGEQP
jgi:hypothetical protein